LRSYGVGEAELGAEPTMEAYLDNTMKWVKEVWRVLKPTGSFVLNIGDSFVASGGRKGTTETGVCSSNRNTPHATNFKYHGFYKPKQLLSVSSFAYCRIVSETDFVCRGEHIWAKPNVPSPIRSRLKHSHEKLFWFVKDADRYYFDSKAWMKQIAASTPARMERAHLTVRPQSGYDGEHRLKPNTRNAALTPWSNTSCFKEIRQNMKGKEKDSPHADNIKLSGSSCFRSGRGEDYLEQKETIEHSWRIVPVGAKQSGFELNGKIASEHIAPYPENLIEPYIKSLCPEDGVVLDPFLGSGTTMRVAMENMRSAIGCELSEKSVAYAKKRLNWGAGLGTEYAEALTPTFPHSERLGVALPKYWR